MASRESELESWTIAQIADEFGVTHRTVRHYEDLGLLSPERRGLNRVYHRRDRTRLNLPDLPGTFLRAKTCLYSNTPDEHFVIARHPAHEAVTVACGFSGHGFKFVPVVGEILADLAGTGTTRHPIELFDPRRFSEVSP